MIKPKKYSEQQLSPKDFFVGVVVGFSIACFVMIVGLLVLNELL